MSAILIQTTTFYIVIEIFNLVLFMRARRPQTKTFVNEGSTGNYYHAGKTK